MVNPPFCDTRKLYSAESANALRRIYQSRFWRSPGALHSAGKFGPKAESPLGLDIQVVRPCTLLRGQVSSICPGVSGPVDTINTAGHQDGILCSIRVRVRSIAAIPSSVASSSAGVRSPRIGNGVDSQCVAFCSSPNTATAWAITGTRLETTAPVRTPAAPERRSCAASCRRPARPPTAPWGAQSGS